MKSLWNTLIQKLLIKDSETPVKEEQQTSNLDSETKTEDIKLNNKTDNWLFDLQILKTENEKIVEVKGDWDNELIEYIKDRGYTGQNDYDLVRKFLNDYLIFKIEEENQKDKRDFI